MKILHVGWGFRPWRPGGLIAYAEDLMAEQARRGHEVAYFLSGRHYPGLRRPRLRRWRRDGVAMLEALNAPVVFALERGTRHPEADLSEPWLERTFAGLLAELRPDVVHVQELAGIPSSVIEVAHDAGVPVLMTLQDYFGLCSTMRLYDSSGAVCLRRQVGADCVATNAGAPADAGPLVARTLHFELERAKRAVPGVRRIDFARARPVVDAVVQAVSRLRAPGPGAAEPAAGSSRDPAALAAAFQRRRDVNVQRLRAVDRLVAPSRRVAEIYRTLGVDGPNLQWVPLTVSHLEHLRPRRLDAPPRPVTFATLGACTSPSKGLHLVLDALRRIAAAGAERELRLLVYGFVDPAAEAELAGHPSVELRGTFGAPQLDEILEEVDVGLLPSVWEEAYPFAGLEFLAKGIPLVATPIGGIVEYAREGETAWLNHARTGEGLADILLAVARAPEQVVERHRRVRELRPELIKPMPAHAEEMDELYRELAAA
ncbi:MAG TPA: glycosyltransferase [Solirubrobacteraceae bacterium]|nr:glycosyltransferase [Solirubrobacteraceae bacterium]